MSIDGKRRTAAMAFVALLILSIWWPAPVVSMNQLCCHARLGIDDLSFLGRESPRWDVAFWCICGLFLFGMLQSGRWARNDFIEPWRGLRRLRFAGAAGPFVALLGGALAVVLIWNLLDAPVTAWAERIQSGHLENVIRFANRFGGGGNPALVVIFFFVAGVVYQHRRWVALALAMTLAGAAAGLAVQIVKYTAGRMRPELWLGPFAHVRTAATSFPSGHTVGAFALGGVLVFASPSKLMRVVAFVLAAAVGLSRILAFRHWTSDVLAAAVIGMVLARVATRAVDAAGLPEDGKAAGSQDDGVPSAEGVPQL